MKKLTATSEVSCGDKKSLILGDKYQNPQPSKFFSSRLSILTGDSYARVCTVCVA